MLLYLLKLSISLGFVYLFYRIFLWKLTFHQWNRWYLLGYTACSFIIPFININPFMEKQTQEQLEWVPNIHRVDVAITTNYREISLWMQPDTWVYILMALGILFFSIRFVIQYTSILGIRRKASVISHEGIIMYKVDENIVPFTFGNAIYLNPQLHTEIELEEILRHEFVHVRQNHSIDMVWTEILCILNWYNPFAWLLRHAIRQNLEFIADHQVLQHGVDKKQYQYLLLKVMGASPYSMGVPFNLNSLKKRINMMNQMRSTKVHLLKFLFILPLLLVLLLSFRTQQLQQIKEDTLKKTVTVTVIDTIPGTMDKKVIVMKSHGAGAPNEIITENMMGAPEVNTAPNAKGYIVSIANNALEEIVIVKNAEGRISKAIPLKEWKDNATKFEKKYGSLPAHKKVFVTVMGAPGIDEGVVLAPLHGQAFEEVRVDASKPGMIKKTITIRTDRKDSLSNPFILIDGVKLDGAEALQKIDPNMISSIEVLKGDKAILAGGQEAKNGVVMVTTKSKGTGKDFVMILDSGSTSKRSVKIISDTVVVHKNEGPAPKEVKEVRVKIVGNPQNGVQGFVGLYIIDGKEYTAQQFKELNVDPQKIESINVLKGSSATAPYGEKGKDGVIVIKLKDVK